MHVLKINLFILSDSRAFVFKGTLFQNVYSSENPKYRSRSNTKYIAEKLFVWANCPNCLSSLGPLLTHENIYAKTVSFMNTLRPKRHTTVFLEILPNCCENISNELILKKMIIRYALLQLLFVPCCLTVYTSISAFCECHTLVLIV